MSLPLLLLAQVSEKQLEAVFYRASQRLLRLLAIFGLSLVALIALIIVVVVARRVRRARREEKYWKDLEEKHRKTDG